MNKEKLREKFEGKFTYSVLSEFDELEDLDELIDKNLKEKI